MTELALIMVSAILVNNFVLVQFLEVIDQDGADHDQGEFGQ